MNIEELAQYKEELRKPYQEVYISRNGIINSHIIRYVYDDKHLEYRPFILREVNTEKIVLECEKLIQNELENKIIKGIDVNSIILESQMGLVISEKVLKEYIEKSDMYQHKYLDARNRFAIELGNLVCQKNAILLDIIPVEFSIASDKQPSRNKITGLISLSKFTKIMNEHGFDLTIDGRTRYTTSNTFADYVNSVVFGNNAFRIIADLEKGARLIKAKKDSTNRR